MLEHLVLIGIDFNPVRATGDKNFWLDIVHLIAPSLKRITVLSLKRHPLNSVSLHVGDCDVVIRYITPSLIENPNTPGGEFPRKLGAIEKMLKARKLLNELDAVGRQAPFQHIHLMDNLGLTNRLIAETAPTRLSVTAFTYKGTRPNFVYDWFLLASYHHEKITVVPYSTAYRDKLLGLGINAGWVRRIPWGVGQHSAVQEEYGCSAEGRVTRPLILWAGYICPIGRADFLYALDSAKRALADGLEADFFFAFKPECYEKGFERFHMPEYGISVKPTTEEEFEVLKDSAHLFFSPVVSRDVIIGPPLTWLEMLARGIPIVTTDVPGVSEAVTDNVNGFITRNGEGLAGKLFDAVGGYREMGPGCKQRITSGYDIDESAKQYLDLWSQLSSPGGL